MWGYHRYRCASAFHQTLLQLRGRRCAAAGTHRQGQPRSHGGAAGWHEPRRGGRPGPELHVRNPHLEGASIYRSQPDSGIPAMRVWLCLLSLLYISTVVALQNGIGHLPIMGWSTWLTFRYELNDTLVRTSTEFLANSKLRAAGYEYILIDDGWPMCAKKDPTTGACIELPPRDADGRIPIDTDKFPRGLKPLTDFIHSKGCKVGIYTAVANRTCGGYWGSLGYEAVDAQAFADWGFDFVKHDTCSTGYCGVYGDEGRDGTAADGNCIEHSATLMSQALQASGRDIIYYVDHGNPANPQKVYNPFLHSVPSHSSTGLVPGTQPWGDAVGWNSLALRPSQLGWTWGARVSHMMKTWYDRSDDWASFLSEIHSQAKLTEYQHCGFFLNPDMLTIGMGGQRYTEYRAQMLMYAVLAAPLILQNDIRSFDPQLLELVTAPEVVRIANDPQCIKGSMVRSEGSYEVWVRPLADGSFAAAVLNKGWSEVQVSLQVAAMGQGSDFFPALFANYTVRDPLRRVDRGTHQGNYAVTVGGHDAVLLRFHPVSPSRG